MPRFDGNERRVHPRAPFSAQIVLSMEAGRSCSYYFTSDISGGGVFAASSVAPKVGMVVDVELVLGDEPTGMQLKGVVGRDDTGQPDLEDRGFAVEFIELTDQHRTQLMDFIDTLLD